MNEIQIKEIKLNEIRILKDNLFKIQKRIDKILSTVNGEGTSGNYSINDELLKCATKIHQSCRILSYFYDPEKDKIIRLIPKLQNIN